MDMFFVASLITCSLLSAPVAILLDVAQLGCDGLLERWFTIFDPVGGRQNCQHWVDSSSRIVGGMVKILRKFIQNAVSRLAREICNAHAVARGTRNVN
jgi:hypothetical protein